jgi:hypothetical protein
LFYLANASYSLSKGILVPYRGVCYHLRKNSQAGKRQVWADFLPSSNHFSG